MAGWMTAEVAVGAVWSSLVFGFGGVRDYGGQLTFEPRLPRAWNDLAFSLRFRGRQIRIKLTHDEERYLVEEGESLNVLIRDEPHLLSPDTPVAIKLPRPQPGPRAQSSASRVRGGCLRPIRVRGARTSGSFPWTFSAGRPRCRSRVAP